MVDNAVLGGRNVSIHCADGVIADIRVDGADRPGVQRAAVDRLDGRGCLVAPGLINAHTHAAMTLFRGRADDLPLMEWLEKHIWPYEEVMTEDEVYAGARLGILEMVRNGITFFNDMYWSSRGTARAAVEMGIRACIGEVFIDGAADANRGVGSRSSGCSMSSRAAPAESRCRSIRMRSTPSPRTRFAGRVSSPRAAG